MSERPRKIMIIENCKQCPFHKLDQEGYERTRELHCICTNGQVYSQTRKIGDAQSWFKKDGEGYPIVCDFPHGNGVLKREYNPFPKWCPLQAFNPIRSDGFWGELSVATEAEWVPLKQQRLKVG